VAVEGGDLLAARHDQNAIGMLDDLFQIGRDQNDAHALIAEAANGLENLLLGAEVDASGRLVEQKHARPPMQPLADDELLLIAAGKMKRVGIEPIGIKADLASERRRGRPPCAGRNHGPPRDGADIRKQEIRERRTREHEPFALAIFRRQRDATSDRLADR
jgi:hypothetical protein